MTKRPAIVTYAHRPTRPLTDGASALGELSLLLPGRTTIFVGTSQWVTISTDPAGADCSIDRKGSPIGQVDEDGPDEMVALDGERAVYGMKGPQLSRLCREDGHPTWRCSFRRTMARSVIASQPLTDNAPSGDLRPARQRSIAKKRVGMKSPILTQSLSTAA